jgi:hypothetical protein
MSNETKATARQNRRDARAREYQPTVEQPTVEQPNVEQPNVEPVTEGRTYTYVNSRFDGKIGCYESAGMSAVLTVNLSSFASGFPTTITVIASGWKAPKVVKPVAPVVALTPEQLAAAKAKLIDQKAKLEAKLAALVA